MTSSEALSIPPATDPFSMKDSWAAADSNTRAEIRQRVCLVLKRIFGQPTILIVTRGFRAVLMSATRSTSASGDGFALPT